MAIDGYLVSGGKELQDVYLMIRDKGMEDGTWKTNSTTLGLNNTSINEKRRCTPTREQISKPKEGNRNESVRVISRRDHGAGVAGEFLPLVIMAKEVNAGTTLRIVPSGTLQVHQRPCCLVLLPSLGPCLPLFFFFFFVFPSGQAMPIVSSTSLPPRQPSNSPPLASTSFHDRGGSFPGYGYGK